MEYKTGSADMPTIVSSAMHSYFPRSASMKFMTVRLPATVMRGSLVSTGLPSLVHRYPISTILSPVARHGIVMVSPIVTILSVGTITGVGGSEKSTKKNLHMKKLFSFKKILTLQINFFGQLKNYF